MKKIDLGRTISILANLGVIAGLVFLALEVRTNTATNRISMYQASSANWMQINRDMATDEELVALLLKAFASEMLDSGEQFQFNAWMRQQLTHGAFVRRLFESGLYSEAEFKQEFTWIRDLAGNPAFRRSVEQVPSSVFRDLILSDENKFIRLLDERGALENRQ